jgi:hypothetical protein
MQKLHPVFLGGIAYSRLSECIGLTGKHLDAACEASLWLQEEVRAKNGIERMALSQMLLAQGRTAWLTQLATEQTQPQALAVALEACERASSTYMKLMRAFNEYRQPKNTGTTVSIGVGQANLAAQQLIQNIQKQSLQEKHDEQTRMRKEGEVIDAEVVSAVKAGTALAEKNNPEKSTVDKKHGTKNSGRKKQSRHELACARRKVRHHRQLSKAGEVDD